MKKIAAFFTAAILFFAVVAVFHFSVSESVDVNNKKFGTWVSIYKDYSCKAIEENLNKDTMLILGSSEFYHGRKTKYHPANLFEKQNVDLMIVGGAYSQSLNQAIKLGAVEKKLTKKKAVFILSPTWFYKSGVNKQAYATKFSETDYMAFMENDEIPKDIKEYVAKRSEKLLDKDQTMQNRVKRYNKMFVDEDVNLIDKIFYTGRKIFVSDKEIISLKTAMWKDSIKCYKRHQAKLGKTDTLDWNKMAADAARESKETTNNEFYMQDRVFERSFEKKMKIAKDSHLYDSFDESPEYRDLECFLKVCKASNVEPLIILQPLNGYWYDYTGLPKEKRDVYRDKVLKIAKEYNASTADFTSYDYSKYFLEDAVHPDGEGWVKINEEIYNFYNKI